MTKKEIIEVLTGIVNQLENHEKNELLKEIFINQYNRKQILEYCGERFITQTEIAILENLLESGITV